MLLHGISSALSGVLNRVPSAYLQQELCGYSTHSGPRRKVSGCWPFHKVAGTHVAVRVRRGVVAVRVEQAVVLVLVVVAADVQHNARSVVVAVVASEPEPQTSPGTTGGITPYLFVFSRGRGLRPPSPYTPSPLGSLWRREPTLLYEFDAAL